MLVVLVVVVVVGVVVVVVEVVVVVADSESPALTNATKKWAEKAKIIISKVLGDILEVARK